MSNKRLRADLALLTCTIIWGATFVAVKDALTDVSVFVYVAVRFALKFSSDHLAIDASDKAALREHFTPEQIVEIGLLCVMCLVGRFSLLAGLEEPSCPM